MQEITHYFTQLWFNDKESDIFITLRKLWSKPASTIASVCGYERVYTYKVLQKFVTEGIIAETISKGVKHFWIPSLDLLRQYVRRHEQKYTTLDEQFTSFQSALSTLNQHYQTSIPKIQIFEQQSGIKILFEDIIAEIERQWLISIKFFGTNTFETQMLSNQTLSTYSQDFLMTLQEKRLTMESYLADGSLTMEHITYLWDTLNIGLLPAGNDAINIFIIGKVFYLIIYKNQPIWLKIESPELAWAMHFLLEQITSK
jgi:hypothetical protein